MFGALIKQHRRRSLLAQSDLAVQADLNIKTIRGIENDQGTLKNLCLVLRCLRLDIAGIPSSDSLGDRLKLARVRRGWSQRRLADQAHLTQATVVKLEKGVGRLSSFYAVCQAMKLKPFLREARQIAFMKGASDCWNTSLEFITKIHSVIPRFDLDPCSNETSYVNAVQTYCEKDDGLNQEWLADFVWLNPPYSSMAQFIKHAFYEWESGRARCIVCLVPARTNPGYFHDYIVGKASVIMLRGRLKFGSSNTQAPFASMLVIWGGDSELVGQLLDVVNGSLIF
ncbi:DNA N-6-adenine-methyltransferase [Terasakiella sp.]|uniref:DNA N-6-adenine-methyltransferase n=1 Tax=Terasakiella sp. TaxID=2034861 RepID=UPI003AA9068E